MDEESIAVVGRFFWALNGLKDRGIIRGKATFAKKYAINRRHMWLLEREPWRGIFKPSWLTWIVRDYGVSAEWLLTGHGEIFGA